jgi:hypothetical protein
MSQATIETLEERVATLEKRLLKLEEVLKLPERRKDWRATVGMFDDDPFFPIIVKLGREYRDKVNRESLK